MKITQPIPPQSNIQLSNKTMLQACDDRKTQQTGTDHNMKETHTQTPVNAECSTNSDLNESNKKKRVRIQDNTIRKKSETASKNFSVNGGNENLLINEY